MLARRGTLMLSSDNWSSELCIILLYPIVCEANQYDEPDISQLVQVKEDAVVCETIKSPSFLFPLLCSVRVVNHCISMYSVQEVGKVHKHLIMQCHVKL